MLRKVIKDLYQISNPNNRQYFHFHFHFSFLSLSFPFFPFFSFSFSFSPEANAAKGNQRPLSDFQSEPKLGNQIIKSSNINKSIINQEIIEPAVIKSSENPHFNQTNIEDTLKSETNFYDTMNEDDGMNDDLSEPYVDDKGLFRVPFELLMNLYDNNELVSVLRDERLQMDLREINESKDSYLLLKEKMVNPEFRRIVLLMLESIGISNNGLCIIEK